MRHLRRKMRRLLSCARRHHTYIIYLGLILLVLFTFRKEIVYHLYIQTLDVQPYEKSVTIWSSDFHTGPIQDLKDILTPLGVKFFDKSLSYGCSRTKTCYSPLRILTRENGMDPSEEVFSNFYQFYKDQTEMNAVDAFVCFHPAGMCELYMPFNRSIIIIASTRYELGRFRPQQWKRLNDNLKRISQDPKNVIAANNLYDAEYIRYFTGINVTVLTSLCDYTHVQYRPTKKEFLLAPIHETKFDVLFRKMLNKSLQKHKEKNIQIVPLRGMYHDYTYFDLTQHPAIIYVPYQVSVMSVFEQYRMNIPLLFPSLDLLTRWHDEYGAVNEKTWDQALYGMKPHHSHINGTLTGVPDPNNDQNVTSIRYWLKFADFYQWPHITYFESTDDLVRKLSSADFAQISEEMKKYNAQLKENLFEKWKEISNNIRRYSKKFAQISS